jgi:hypothetical protein
MARYIDMFGVCPAFARSSTFIVRYTRAPTWRGRADTKEGWQLQANGTRQKDMLDYEISRSAGGAQAIVVLEGARAGESIQCVAATFGALRSVVSHVEHGEPRHLPEGGYAFENVSRLQARLVLIPNGQVCPPPLMRSNHLAYKDAGPTARPLALP